MEDNPPTYMFHQLFQDFLRSCAKKQLSIKQQRVIFAKSGQWYLRQDQPEQALHYYIKASAYAMAEKILRSVGPRLLGANRIDSLKEALKEIPPEIINIRPWFSFSMAAVHSTTDPLKSKVYLDQAYGRFIIQKDEMGELLTIATLIAYHTGVDCNFKHGKKLLPRAEALYNNLSPKIPVAMSLPIASAIAYGLCYFVGQFQRAAEYTQKMIEIARERELYDTMTTGILAQGLISSFEGNWLNFRRYIEESSFLLQSPRVCSRNKLGLIVLQIGLLIQQGDLITTKKYRQLVDSWVDPKLLTTTLFGPMFINFDTSLAILEGRLEDAKAYLQKGLDAAGSNRSAHMQSIFWGRLAYVYIQLNENENAMMALDESQQLRQQVGGTYYEIANKVIAGSIYALSGEYERSEWLLSKAISELKQMGRISMLLSAYAHRAEVRFQQNKLSTALADLKKFMTLLQDNPFPFYHTYNPKTLKKLLKIAILHNINAKEAGKLAKKILQITITPKGILIPILEITTLGKLEIKIKNKVKITFNDLTKTQRELLALLTAFPSKKGISHTVIQEALWPDSPPDKVRSKLDNLLSRLRKVFNRLLAPYPARDYLSMERGQIKLQNCQTDTNSFRHAVQQGIRHIKHSEYWQASNEFIKAHFFFKGEFMPGVHLHEPIAYIREELQQSLVEISLYWIQLLSEAKRTDEAIRVCKKTLQFAPSNESLVQWLYNSMHQSNDIVQAKKVIVNYKKALEQDGFSNEEIENFSAEIIR
jgi:DNA-binding SARP family transcriptional activator/tetratricopeptide (TPR) repeat protein